MEDSSICSFSDFQPYLEAKKLQLLNYTHLNFLLHWCNPYLMYICSLKIHLSFYHHLPVPRPTPAIARP